MTARWLVLFSRCLADDVDVLPANPTQADKWSQLFRELAEADPGLLPELVAEIEAHPFDVFAATVSHDGDRASLVERLQACYDDFGVGGFFNTPGGAL